MRPLGARHHAAAGVDHAEGPVTVQTSFTEGDRPDGLAAHRLDRVPPKSSDPPEPESSLDRPARQSDRCAGCHRDPPVLVVCGVPPYLTVALPRRTLAGRRRVTGI